MKRPIALLALVLLALVLLALWMSRPLPPTPRAPAAPTPSAPAVPPAPPARPTPDSGAASAPRVTPAPPVHAARDGAVVVSGPWGSEPGMFGREDAHESNPEGPMALAVAADGTVLVLDQVNRRIQRFSQGVLAATLPLPTAATQDVTVSRDGTVVSLNRLVGREVRLHFANGETRSAPVEVGPIREGGAVSGVFTDAEGVWVEREHQELVRVASASGERSTDHPTLYGRPTRDGQHLLRAAIEDREAGVVRVSVAARENGAMDWATAVPLGATVLQVILLDSDAAGRVYLGASVARLIAGAAPTLADERVVVVRLDTAGALAGTLQLPALPGEDEVFRPLTIDDAGAVYMLISTARGLEVRRWEFQG